MPPPVAPVEQQGSSVSGVSPAFGHRVRFSDELYATFMHPRCMECHQFNSQIHNGRAFTSHHNRYICENCHTPKVTGLLHGEWMAPPAKMDLTGLDAHQVCELIKRNSGHGDVNANLARHMLEDTRVRWALDSGLTPGGARPTVPGGYAAWERKVHAWVAAGMSCD